MGRTVRHDANGSLSPFIPFHTPGGITASRCESVPRNASISEPRVGESGRSSKSTSLTRP